MRLQVPSLLRLIVGIAVILFVLFASVTLIGKCATARPHQAPSGWVTEELGSGQKTYIVHSTYELDPASFSNQVRGVEILTKWGKYSVMVKVGMAFEPRHVLDSLINSFQPLRPIQK